MDKGLVSVIAVVSVGLLLYFVKPLFSVVILASFGVLLFAWIYRSGAYIFAKPLARDESLCFYITKQGQVLVDQMKRTGEGFLKFKDHFGVLEVTEDSDYHAFGKPVNIAVEGVSHTVIPQFANLTHDLAKMGFEDWREAEKILEEEK